MEFFRGAQSDARAVRASFLASSIDLTHAQHPPLWRIHRAYGHGDDFRRTGRRAFNRDVQKEMKPGQTMQIGQYTLLLQSLDSQAGEELHRRTHDHRSLCATTNS